MIALVVVLAILGTLLFFMVVLVQESIKEKVILIAAYEQHIEWLTGQWMDAEERLLAARQGDLDASFEQVLGGRR